MSLKQLIILFVILFFLPVVLGKVSVAPLVDGIKSFSLPAIWEGFTTVLDSDINFYLGWLAPWIEKAKNLIKGNLPPEIQQFVP